MKTKTPVKVIKKQERIPRRPKAKTQAAIGPKRWSKSIRTWVAESQGRDRRELLPAFDSLFKDAEPQVMGSEETG